MDIRKEINPAAKAELRRRQSPESFVERVARLKNPVTNEVKNPEFVAPIASDSEWMERVNYAVSASPATRRRGESLDELNQRRSEAYDQELAEAEGKRTGSTEMYERGIKRQLAEMNL